MPSACRCVPEVRRKLYKRTKGQTLFQVSPGDAISRIYPAIISQMQELRGIAFRALYWGVGVFTGAFVYTAHKGGLTGASFEDRVLISFALVAFVTLFAFIMLKVLEYYEQIMSVVVKLDRAQGAFESGTYLDGESLYPHAWMSSDKTVRKSSLLAPVIWVVITCLFIGLSLIWHGHTTAASEARPVYGSKLKLSCSLGSAGARQNKQRNNDRGADSSWSDCVRGDAK